MVEAVRDGSSPREKRKHDDHGDDTTSHLIDPKAKRPRVIGPVMPPAHSSSPPSQENEEQDKHNHSNDDDDDDDDDDEYGPSLPPTDTRGRPVPHQLNNEIEIDQRDRLGVGPSPPAPEPSKRDDWMLRPPDHLDFSSRVDPTKLRNRKFNTGRSANTSAGKPAASTWTETTEEKRKRLENEVMGIQAPATSLSSDIPNTDGQSLKIKEYNEKRARDKSLYAQHQGKPRDTEADDPSARAFDKEKDIRGPSKISHAQQRELLNKSSSNISSRFSGGKFL